MQTQPRSSSQAARSSQQASLTHASQATSSATGRQASGTMSPVVAAVVVVGVSIVFYRAFLVLTFDETLARLLGLRPRLAHGLLLGLIAVAIVASFQTVGNLLVFAFLVAPPATAALVVRRVPLIMVTAVLLGSFSALVGVLVSYHHDTAAGATMALASVAIFFVALFAVSLRTSIRSRAQRSTSMARSEPTPG